MVAAADPPEIAEGMREYLADPDMVWWLRTRLEGRLEQDGMTETEAEAYAARLSPRRVAEAYAARFWGASGLPGLLKHVKASVLYIKAYYALFHALSDRQQRAVKEYEEGTAEAVEIQRNLPNRRWAANEKTAWDELCERCHEGHVLKKALQEAAREYVKTGEKPDLQAHADEFVRLFVPGGRANGETEYKLRPEKRVLIEWRQT